MNRTDAVINPQKGKKSPSLGPLALIISSQKDMKDLCALLDIDENSGTPLVMSKVYSGNASGLTVSVTGPAVSAPYAVMLLEPLIAWGAEQFIFFGWCGAVSDSVKTGDIIIPTGAFIDEGTSRHYLAEKDLSVPSDAIVGMLKDVLVNQNIPFREGLIWTTDAVYRETVEKVQYYQGRNALAVEMELSALFTAAKFRNAEIGAILVVSDELSTYQWRPGFKNERFIRNRTLILETLKQIAVSS